MTWLINLEVTWVLCHFRLVPEEKVGKHLNHWDDSSQRFLETTLPYLMHKTISQKHQIVEVKPIYLMSRTLLAILKNRKSQIFGKWYFYFISTNTFPSLKSPFATTTTLSGLGLRDTRFILLVQTKEMIFMS